MRTFLKINWLNFFSGLGWYLEDLFRYRRMNGNEFSTAKFSDLKPYLADKTAKTEIEPIYFLQDIWLAEKLFALKPKKHIDIASSVKTVAIISKLIPTVFVDLRPPDVSVAGLQYLKGSVLSLPFKSKSVLSISSICVLEHIGLGRYGDKIDPWGSEKAIAEITRVLKPGGYLFISVPVDRENRAFFNAHRTFTRRYLLSLFAKEFNLKEEKYIYGKKVWNKYDEKKGFGTGLYYFQKK